MLHLSLFYVMNTVVFISVLLSFFSHVFPSFLLAVFISVSLTFRNACFFLFPCFITVFTITFMLLKIILTVFLMDYVLKLSSFVLALDDSVVTSPTRIASSTASTIMNIFVDYSHLLSGPDKLIVNNTVP